MLTVTPFLWFENQAEEAMNYYASIFPRSRIISVQRVNGSVMGVEFELEGQKFKALNYNTKHKFNDSVSFFVGCDTQEQIDEFWDKLIAGGGAPTRCGWLKDKFGVTWQIVPNTLGALLGGGDAAASKRVMDALLAMDKLDMHQLQAAFDAI